jgi:F-type H+-transporting ATPase subunit a
MEKGPHISVKAEELLNISGFSVTNSYATSLIVILLFCLIAIYYNHQLKQNIRSRGFYLIQFVLESIYNFFHGVVEGKIDRLFTLLASLFIYIFLTNWFGLLPGVGSVLIKVFEHGEEHMVPLLRASTTDLNMTLALALISFTAIQYYGVKTLGVGGYVQKFFNVKNPITFITGPLEVISEFSRIISFSFRLFGNIFAGEVIMGVISFLIPVLASFPFLLLEMFVGFIQAFVFAMLTAVFINLAMAKAH